MNIEIAPQSGELTKSLISFKLSSVFESSK